MQIERKEIPGLILAALIFVVFIAVPGAHAADDSKESGGVFHKLGSFVGYVAGSVTGAAADLGRGVKSGFHSDKATEAKPAKEIQESVAHKATAESSEQPGLLSRLFGSARFERDKDEAPAQIEDRNIAATHESDLM